VLDAEVVERLVDLTNDELESTVLDPPSVELLKDGSGELVDDTAAGVFVRAGDVLPVLLCIANLFAAPRSRLRNKRNNARRNDRMESIFGAPERPVQASQRNGEMVCIPK
jgi:hypothetical protein